MFLSLSQNANSIVKLVAHVSLQVLETEVKSTVLSFPKTKEEEITKLTFFHRRAVELFSIPDGITVPKTESASYSTYIQLLFNAHISTFSLSVIFSISLNHTHTHTHTGMAFPSVKGKRV